MKQINEIYKELLIKLNTAPVYSPRGQKVKELLNQTIILNPKDCTITLDGFKTNVMYAWAEREWYFSGTNTINYSETIAKVWKKYSDNGKTVNSAYGYYIYGDNHGLPNQMEYVINKFKEDKDTRQAVININNPFHKIKFNTRDFPCTLSIQFLIRDNKLHMIVGMRSNDLFYGFRNDIFCFAEIQKSVFNKLIQIYPKLELGNYYHNAASLHLYENQWKKVEEMIQNEN